jgi:hypothetical protein
VKFIKQIDRCSITSLPLNVYPFDAVLRSVWPQHILHVLDGSWIFGIVANIGEDERAVWNDALRR